VSWIRIIYARCMQFHIKPRNMFDCFALFWGRELQQLFSLLSNASAQIIRAYMVLYVHLLTVLKVTGAFIFHGMLISL
jgi:hypothetical protein